MKERLLFLICFLCISFMLKAADKPVIKISTENVDLIYRVGNNGRLYQSYLGKRLNHATDIAHLPQGSEAYLTHGMEDYFEPAIHIVHNDGNPSTLLKYVSHTRNQVSPGVDEVVITMQDDKYPVTVKLHYVAYQKENLIKTFTEISHREKKPVQLHKYASSMLHLNRANYFLTEFSGRNSLWNLVKKRLIPSWEYVPICSALLSSNLHWTESQKRTKVKCWSEH